VDGIAAEIFDGRKFDPAAEDRSGMMPPFHPDFLKDVIEVEAGTVGLGDVWNGAAFEKPEAM
jgi:hypothetical protein